MAGILLRRRSKWLRRLVSSLSAAILGAEPCCAVLLAAQAGRPLLEIEAPPHGPRGLRAAGARSAPACGLQMG